DDPPPDCTICHIQPWGGHMDNLGTNVLCSSCHYSLDPGATGVLHVMTFSGNENSCIKCHVSTRQQVKDSIINGIAGQLQDCTNCHGVEDTLYHPTPPTNVQHDMVSITASCTACHVAADMGDVYAIHRGDCIVCHSHTLRQEVLDAVEKGQSFTSTPPPVAVTCVTCHSVGHIQADSHQITLASAQCNNCHGSLATSNQIVDLHDRPTNSPPGPCATCHNTGVRQQVKDVINAGVASNCSTCHAPYLSTYENHLVQDHNGVTGIAACTGCHTGNIITAVHGNGTIGTCTLCHTPITGVKIAGVNGHGTAVNGSGTCTFCHPAYFAGHVHNHAVTVKVNSAISPITDNCVGCHSATTSPFIGTAPNQVHSALGCATCHSPSNGSRTGSAQTTTGECSGCHTGTFAGHSHSHTITQRVGIDQSQGQLCNTCHSQFANTWIGILGLHNNFCGLCHNETRLTTATSGITIQQVISAGADPTGCLICHDRAGLHGLVNHSATGQGALSHVTDTPSCVASCHPANDPMTVHNNTCTKCHTATPTLADPVNRNFVTAIAKGTCAGCHAGYFIGHTHSHAASILPTTLCASCHTGDGITAVHMNNCALCHNPANGSRISGVSGHGDATVNSGNGGTCAECHVDYFDAHTHSHSTQVKKNLASTPLTANCVGCHTATVSPFIGAGQVHAPQGCVTCHNTTNGALKAPAVIGGGECVACHSTYFNAHDHGAIGGAVNHTIQLNPVIDRSQVDSQPCSNCHVVSNFTEILAVHKTGGCVECHNTTRDINPAAPSGTTVAMVIANANQSTVNCVNCHMDKIAPAVHLHINHGAQPEGLGHILDTPFCVGCHAVNDPMTVHSNKCGNCHTSPPNLQDPVDRPRTIAITPDSTCVQCHGVNYFTGPHGHDHTATVTSTALCVNCHSGSTITGVHKNNCFLCHSNVNGSRIVGASGNGDAMVNGGGGGSCADCHAGYFNSHDHAHTNQVKKNLASSPLTANCVGCHTAITTP
ncbi:MAG: hypothetical protein Q8J76_14170, partial [Desulfobulbaceae bacterium]|nr:hypothetical protein [Desulfobulbaceae bacterium]